MVNWNAQFTQLIRKSNNVLWGNWTLSSEVAPGAVGILDPSSGSFKLVAASLPDLSDDGLQRNASSRGRYDAQSVCPVTAGAARRHPARRSRSRVADE